MKHLLIPFSALILSLTPVAAESRFDLLFTDGCKATVHGIEGTPSATPEINAPLASEGADDESRSAIIAEQQLEAFQPFVAPKEKLEPSQGLRYLLPTALNPEQGELTLSFNPLYNGNYPTPKEGGYPHRLYYLFDSGHPDPDGGGHRLGGLQLLLRHSKVESGDAYVLMLIVGLANGEKVTLNRSVAAHPEQWHTVRVRWTRNQLSLHFNDHRLAEQPIDGPLARFEEFFTLGGSWYGTWPLQGRLGRVQIRGGE